MESTTPTTSNDQRNDDYVAPSIVEIDTVEDREFAVMPAGGGSTTIFD